MGSCLICVIISRGNLHGSQRQFSVAKSAKGRVGRPDDPSAIQLIQPWFCSWNGSVENDENVKRGRRMQSGASPATARMCIQERVLTDVGPASQTGSPTSTYFAPFRQ